MPDKSMRKNKSKRKHKAKSKIKSNTKSNTNKTKKLKGGRFIGKGSFGCVITPAISCPKLDKSEEQQKLDKHVSKILINPDEDVKEEIKLSKIVRNLDPNSNYFITFTDACRLRQIPSNRSNVTSVRYTDDSFSEWRNLEYKKTDKDFCPIDLGLKPINLVMPYAGMDLLMILSKQSKDPNARQILSQILVNFKSGFKNLLQGMYKLHNARIVNRDIKMDNIIADYNESRELQIKYIDFGLASHLTEEYTTNINNVGLQGTPTYIPLEIFIAYNINKYLDAKYGDSYILSKIFRDINESVKPMYVDLKERNVVNQLGPMVNILFQKIKGEFKTKMILDNFFGQNSVGIFDGYLQKADVYSLGLTLYEFLDIAKGRVYQDTLLYDLIKHMIELDPVKRYNVVDCMKHSYWQ
jgi:serine/threonine protein kinase